MGRVAYAFRRTSHTPLLFVIPSGARRAESRDLLVARGKQVPPLRFSTVGMTTRRRIRFQCMLERRVTLLKPHILAVNDRVLVVMRIILERMVEPIMRAAALFTRQCGSRDQQ